MAIPTNIKSLLSGEVVEWARIEYKETWDAAASLKTICFVKLLPFAFSILKMHHRIILFMLVTFRQPDSIYFFDVLLLIMHCIVKLTPKTDFLV